MNNKEKSSFLWRFSKKFQFAAENIIPDPLVFCLILTLILFISGILFTKTSILDMLKYWYNGIWSQIGFAFQMSFMVVTCSVTAKSNVVKNILRKMAAVIKTLGMAIIILMIFGYISSFLNWAFGTIVTPIFGIYLTKRIKGLHFPILVAAGYSTMILGQCMGPSASVYALLASSDHFLVDKIGVLPQNITTYNKMNVILWFILAIGTIILTILTKPPVSEVVEFSGEVDEKEVIEEVKNKKTFADIMNKNSLIMYLIGLAGLVNIIITIKEKDLLASLSLNFVIFIFLTLNFFLYATPEKFIKSYRNNLSLATDVMIQFPFYGGISGMMTNSGLGILLVGYFTKLATTTTLPLWSYISASLLNLFIPSQGGQWIVQGSIIIDAALELGARIPDVVNAFVYADEATNLLQPLYVIPALSVVGMKLKDVWGYMAFIWIFWFIVTSIGLILIPALL